MPVSSNRKRNKNQEPRRRHNDDGPDNKIKEGAAGLACVNMDSLFAYSYFPWGTSCAAAAGPAIGLQHHGPSIG